MKRSNETPTSPKRLTIGLACYRLNNIFSANFWTGIRQAAQERDVNLFFYAGGALPNGERHDPPAAVYELIDPEHMDGMVFWGSQIINWSGPEGMRKFYERFNNLPAISEGSEAEGVPCLVSDFRQGARDLINHLIEVHHHRRILFIRGPEIIAHWHQITLGYKDALEAHGIPFDARLVVEEDDFRKLADERGFTNVYDALPVLLEELNLHPGSDYDAVYAGHDTNALRLLDYYQSIGINVPRDMPVVGFSDLPPARYGNPPLTTVRNPIVALGHRATSLLIDHLEGKQPLVAVTPSPLQLVIRQSCGCKELPTLKLEPPSTEPTLEPLQAQREAILAALKANGAVAPLGKQGDWAGRLFNSFVADLNGQEKAFWQALSDLLSNTMSAGLEVSIWQEVLWQMRHQMLPWLPGGSLPMAEELWQYAQIMVSKSVQQAQETQGYQNHQKMDDLLTISAMLVSTFDMKALCDMLAKRLPELGIPAAYLSLYEDPNNLAGRARLVMAYNEQGRIALPEGGMTFFAPELIPPDLQSPQQRVSRVIESIHLDDQQLGFIIYENGSCDWTVYNLLRQQIASAVYGATLVQRVEERSAELTRQNYILDMFMANVPDRIYFKDLASRFTRVNKALLDKLGLADYPEVIGKSDFDFFPEQQARPKFAQEQQIIKTGQAILNEEEPDGEGFWALTTKMPLRNEHNQIVGTFGISRDITELVRTRQAAEAAKDEALQARKVAVEAKEEAERARHEVEAANASLAAQIWQTAGQAQLNEKMRGEQDVATLARNVIQQICEYLGIQTGVLYIHDNNLLKLAGSYAYIRQGKKALEFEMGEGLIGEVALSKKAILLNDLPDTQKPIASGLVRATPRSVAIVPLSYADEVVGVVELGSLKELGKTQMDFLDRALESVAIAFLTAQARGRVNELYSQTRQQADELQAQEEELRATNEELEAQTESLRASEAKLRQNQAELEAANVELEEKAHILQEQQAKVDQQNRELERKAEELALASKYKSEFLANMSHELRTPLNSMLILAGMLAKNESGHLTPDEVESAQVIYSGGNDLLNLINEILDLAKVEAGKMEFHFAPMPWDYLIERMQAQFDPVSQRKGLRFNITVADDVPDPIVTDGQRLAQIVKNLLSNAFKFTEKGSVTLRVHRPASDVNLSASGLTPQTAVAVSVTDTGIGMTPKQQKIVFEAFTQADGGTSRQFGGTGLGLTITREMTHRLGGQVTLTSKPGKGSTFTIYLPVQGIEEQGIGDRGIGDRQPITKVANAPFSASQLPAGKARLPLSPFPSTPFIPDDRASILPSDHLLLIVEDDPSFAKIVADYAHNKSFKAIAAADGESALQLLQAYHPHAVVLDLGLPGMSGWEVLDQIKNNPDTRHIPIHIISAADEDVTAFQRGAIGFLTKPVSQEGLDTAFQHIEQLITAKIKSLLLVEDDDTLRLSVRKLLEGNDIAITEASLGQTALEKLASQRFDCMILDLSLPDMTGFELLGHLHNDETLIKCPVIVYTGKELTPEENQELLKYADSVIVKGVKSPERLLDETALFLHRVIADLPEDKQRTIRMLHNPEAMLDGKQILLVDDDTRNAFALSRLLADKGMKMYIAPSGLKALEALEKVPQIALVLTDIMMPGMDGFELIQRIRQQARFKGLPIIAITAKAMMGDREKCIDAGANDYLSKPIDSDRLFSMLRVWLSRE